MDRSAWKRYFLSWMGKFTGAESQFLAEKERNGRKGKCSLYMCKQQRSGRVTEKLKLAKSNEVKF